MAPIGGCHREACATIRPIEYIPLSYFLQLHFQIGDLLGKHRLSSADVFSLDMNDAMTN